MKAEHSVIKTIQCTICHFDSNSKVINYFSFFTLKTRQKARHLVPILNMQRLKKAPLKVTSGERSVLTLDFLSTRFTLPTQL